ncbi:hypothetical protein GIB67_019542, partial [Kingdonia uniflora]
MFSIRSSPKYASRNNPSFWIKSPSKQTNKTKVSNFHSNDLRSCSNDFNGNSVVRATF